MTETQMFLLGVAFGSVLCGIIVPAVVVFFYPVDP